MTDVGAIIQQTGQVFGQMKAALDANKLDACDKHLRTLQGLFVGLPTYLNPSASSPSKVQEAVLVRESLEYAVLLCARRANLDDMERYYQQLKLYYTDFTDVALPPSERRLLMTGLNLLRLLVQSKIAEFHSELAAIPHSEHSTLFIKQPINLERYIMEGSYSRLLNAKNNSPSPDFIPLLERLQDTIRTEIAHCIPKSYARLTMPEAASVLMLGDAQEAKQFGTTMGWKLAPNGSAFDFTEESEESGAGGKRKSLNEIAFRDVLTENVQFALQLQRVI